MNMRTESQGQVRHEEIAQLAKHLWEGEGGQAGRDVEYWLRAERELHSGRNRASDPAPNPESAVTARPAGTTPAARGHASTSRGIHF